MLPYKNRLIKTEDFGRVYRLGRLFSGKKLAIKINRNNLGRVRVGVSVGARFSSKAVKRNQLKRQIREFFRKKIKNVEKGWDIVVIAKKTGADKKEKTNIEEMLAEILSAAGIFN